jgi:hypothetical protein
VDRPFSALWLNAESWQIPTLVRAHLPMVGDQNAPLKIAPMQEQNTSPLANLIIRRSFYFFSPTLCSQGRRLLTLNLQTSARTALWLVLFLLSVTFSIAAGRRSARTSDSRNNKNICAAPTKGKKSQKTAKNSTLINIVIYVAINSNYPYKCVYCEITRGRIPAGQFFPYRHSKTLKASSLSIFVGVFADDHLILLLYLSISKR